jgi:hypothetical protein
MYFQMMIEIVSNYEPCCLLLSERYVRLVITTYYWRHLYLDTQ